MSLINLLLKTTETVTPLSTLTSLSTYIADKELGKGTQFLIKQFIKTFKINLDEIENQDLSSYKTFNDFFIRKLKADARPIDMDAFAVSPVDGTIGQADNIKAGRLIQAKGLDYSLLSLVGGDPVNANLFENGTFACIYLSPANYHRIHMPIDGKLLRTIHIPGKHFPVGKKNISHLEDLYTDNERLVCIFNTDKGPISLIFVGAALVGSIGTTWDGTVKRKKGIEVKYYNDSNIEFKRGDEIGHFKYGSTVICLFPKDFATFGANFQNGKTIQMGQTMLINSLAEKK